ncbi:hypothetical protein M758_4G120200 [Ceratodon purpureus]|nr:hypothetical protein M758_4G120200 [Ceratodon purpureus]
MVTAFVAKFVADTTSLARSAAAEPTSPHIGAQYGRKKAGGKTCRMAFTSLAISTQNLEKLHQQSEERRGENKTVNTSAKSRE